MLKRLRVRNYKSLRNVDIPLRPLTVLVGPNAAGKSNILDALLFLAELATNDQASKPFINRGGFADVVSRSDTEGEVRYPSVQDTRSAFADVAWGGEGKLPISFELEGSVSFHGSREPMEYAITVTLDDTGYISVTEERAAWGKERQELLRRHGNEVQSPAGVSAPFSSLLLLAQLARDLRRQEVQALQQAMGSCLVYDFQRPKIADRQPVRKDTRLAPDGSNAATVLHWVRNEDVATFNRLESLLKTAIPEVEHLLTPPDEQGQVYIAFKEKHLPGRIPAWSLSEGSARLVATLLALFVPKPPALVAIEAPETSLHPYLMEYLADILKLGSKETQIIITTHSPYLLNHLPPESLVIVTKEKGETKVKRVRRDRALTEALKVLGLGEMWHAGHLGGVP